MGESVSGSDGERRGERFVFCIMGKRWGKPRRADDPVVEAAKYNSR